MPDLLGCGAAVDLRVGGVLELLGDEVAPVSFRHLFRFTDGTRHALTARGEHQPGSISSQQHSALLAECIGHGQHALITAGSAYHRQ